MALTSQASASTNFQVRGFSIEPRQFRRVSIGEQARKKSATERLIESQGQFARRKSQEELKASYEEDSSPTELSGIYTARQVDVIPNSDDTEGHSSIPCIRSSVSSGVSQSAEKSQPLRPVSDESLQAIPSHKYLAGSRDGTIDDVAVFSASGPSLDDDTRIFAHDGDIDSKRVENTLPRTLPVSDKSPLSFATRKHSGGGRDRTLEIVTTSLARSTSPVGNVLISSDSNIDPKPMEKFLPKRAPPVSDKSPQSFHTRKQSGGSRDRTLEIVTASLARSTSPVDDALVSSDRNSDPKPVETFLPKRAPVVPVKSPQYFPTRKQSGGSRDRTLEIVTSSLARSTSPVDDALIYSDSNSDRKPVETFLPKRAPVVPVESPQSFRTRKQSGGSRDRTLAIVTSSSARSTSPIDDAVIYSDSHSDPKPVETFLPKRAPPVPVESPQSFRTRKQSGGSRDRTLEIVTASLARSTSPIDDAPVFSDSNSDPKPVKTFLPKRAPQVPVKSPQSFRTRKQSGGSRDRTLEIVTSSLALGKSSDEGGIISSSDADRNLEEISQPQRPSPVPDKSPPSTPTHKHSGGSSETALESVTASLANKSYGKSIKSPSDHQPVVKSGPSRPSPFLDKSPHSIPMRARGGSRDRTLEIVAASLALSTSDDDGGEISSILAKNSNSSASNSPLTCSSQEEAGGHVRKLKEHFLNAASTESESEGSHGRQIPTELQKSESSPSSYSFELEKGTGDQKRAEPHSISRTQTDVSHRTDAWQLETSTRRTLREQSQLKATNHSRSRSTSSEEDPVLRNENRGKSLTKPPSGSSDALDEQTRRQMERFKARYAAADAAKQNRQEGKINKIVVKLPAHTGDTKNRSKSVHDSVMSKTSIVRPRSQTSKEAVNHPIEASVAKAAPSKPKASSHSTTQHSKSERVTVEKGTNYGTLHKTSSASYHESSNKREEADLRIPETLTSSDIRRMRRAKQLNVCGKTPERWGDVEESSKPFIIEEFHKPQKSIIEHAVYHGGDRTVIQVGGTTFPVKQEVNNTVYKDNLPDKCLVKDELTSVNHRREKSTSDDSSVEKSSGAEEVTTLLSRNQNQNDMMDEEALKSKYKASSTKAFYKHVMKSPDTAKGFQMKSWSPVNFGFTQDKSNTSNSKTTQHVLSHTDTISPDITQCEESQSEKRTSKSNPAPQPLASQDDREHAKSALQNFLSGIMTSPRGTESPCSLTAQNKTNAENDNNASPPQNDDNGNCIVTDAWTPEISNQADINKGQQMYREAVDDVNSNFYSVNQNEPFSVGIFPPAGVELTSLCNRDTFERKRSETQDDQIDAGHESKMQFSPEGLKNTEFEKRRKVSQNSDACLSRQDGAHCGPKEQAGSHVEKPCEMKMSLSNLLSQEVTQERTVESLGQNEQSKESEVDKQAKPDSKRLPPPRPDLYHGDDSEWDTEEELRRSKVLRVKKPSVTEKRIEDNSFQNLLSRIINPEDELYTLKRGKKSMASKTSEMAMHPKRHTTAQEDGADDKLTFRKPLINLNLLQKKNQKPVRQDLASPPDSMASPIRHGRSRRRSKSDLGMSPRCSVSSAPSEVEHFFNRMGLNDSFFQSPTRRWSDNEEDVFNDMHEYKHARDDASFTTEHSDNISQGSKVSEEGLHLANKLPDTSKSIITKNARVIKWLCQMRKARASSFS